MKKEQSHTTLVEGLKKNQRKYCVVEERQETYYAR